MLGQMLDRQVEEDTKAGGKGRKLSKPATDRLRQTSGELPGAASQVPSVIFQKLTAGSAGSEASGHL